MEDIKPYSLTVVFQGAQLVQDDEDGREQATLLAGVSPITIPSNE